MPIIDKYIKDYSNSEEVVEGLFNFVSEKYETVFENTISDSDFSLIVPDDLEQEVIEKMIDSEKWFRGSDYYGLDKSHL